MKHIDIPSAKAEWKYDVLTYEFKPDLNAYLNGLHPSIQIRTLADLIEFNKSNEEKMLKYGQAVLLKSEETSGSLTEKTISKHWNMTIYHSTMQGIDYALEK